FCSCELQYFLSKFADRNLIRVADVNRQVIITHEQPEYAIYQVIYITEATGLTAIAEHCEILSPQSLTNERRQNTAVIQAHSGAVGIENSHDTGFERVIIVVSHSDGFHKSFCLVVAAARSNRIHIAPIRFSLRM